MTPQARKKQEDRIQQLVREIGENTDAVDELVHEAKAEEAAEVNNKGVEEQIRYLVDSWGLESTDEALCDTLGLKKLIKTEVVVDSMDQHIKCKHCGKSEPVPFPMEVMAFVKWSEKWTEPHKEGICREVSAGGGVSPSTGQNGSSTPS